jgi:hypothetical protein
MNIACNDILKLMGTHCQSIGNEHLLISTPLNFIDNTPINVFVSKNNDTFIITDDGDVLMRLHGLGLGSNPRLFSSIEKRVISHNGFMDNGRIVFHSNVLREAYANYLLAIIEILNYELENTSLENEKILAINEVINAIQRRNPNAFIETDVIIEGSTGSKLKFPIKAGNRLIEVTFPHHRSTGSILRKIADVEKGGFMEPLVIVDDTSNYESAMRESSLIGTFVPSMLLSTLKSENSPLNLHA